MEQAPDLKMTVKLTVVNPELTDGSAFGRGIASLCLGVRETGSLYAAAKRMNMAYSKAWRVIRDTEEDLGIQLLDRDGAHGSTLTAEGDKLLDAYLEVDEKLQKIAEEEFAKRFS
jgi:molybdate transport system regulatory protein